MMKIYDCGDFYFFGNYQKRAVEIILEDELGIKQIVEEITWEEYEQQKQAILDEQLCERCGLYQRYQHPKTEKVYKLCASCGWEALLN